jgi:hypothetical protein
MSKGEEEGIRFSYKDRNNTTAIIVGFVIVIASLQLLGYSDNLLTAAFAQGPQGGNYTFGILASTQNNENGDPFWIVSGNWRTNLLDMSNQLQNANQSNMTIEILSSI